MNFALAPPRADRHPVGLAIVIGLHVLLAAAMLTARLRGAPVAPAPPPLAKIEQPPPAPPPSHDLPPPPQALLHPLVAPVPEVVADRPEPGVQAVAPAPVAAAAPAPAPAKAGPVATDATRAAAHGVRIDAGNQACRPVYPHVAEREGVEGVTKLRITVDAGGRVTGAEILQASGRLRQNRNMDQAAIEALTQCPVAAGVDEFGRPVGGAVEINYKWTIL